MMKEEIMNAPWISQMAVLDIFCVTLELLITITTCLSKDWSPQNHECHQLK